MSLITWNDSFSVNISKIDNEHKKLIEILNFLHAKMLEGKSTKEVIRPVLESLVAYAKMHFETEEELFNEHGYPKTKSHVKQHQDFIDKVNQFIRDYKADKVGISVDIMNFLRDWLFHHIMESDKQYTAYLNSKGVK